MSKENKLFIISGASGSGKTSIMRQVMGRDKEIISVTTRPKRDGEVCVSDFGIGSIGKDPDYKFISKEAFQNLKMRRLLAEYSNYGDNQYGITKQEIDEKLAEGHAYAIVDYHGMIQLDEIHKNNVKIFLHTSEEDALRNMLGRGDSYENIMKRMKTFEVENVNKQFYDYCVLNRYGKMENAKFVIENIIKAELDELPREEESEV